MTETAVRHLRLRHTSIPGCTEVELGRLEDLRGSFVKLFRSSTLAELGFVLAVGEVFVSTSRHGVVRGMHVQAPPAGGARLVSCLSGRAYDVVLDLRVGSPSYGRAAVVHLSADAANAVFVPDGCAHGFAALVDGCTLAYVAGAEHDPELDVGVHWSSVDVDWPFDSPIVSERDASLPRLVEFDSPFRYGGAHG